jgi:hypothetical protein
MMPVIPWLQPRQTLVRKQQRFKKSNVPVKYIVIISIAVFLLANLFFLMHVMDDDVKPIQRKAKQETGTTPSEGQANACTFRHYPPHRYYKLQDKAELQPDFLTGTSAWSVDYIYGQWPLLLQASSTSTQRKLCVDQSEWLPSSISDTTASKSKSNELPFADGTNPSILSVEHIHRHQKQFGTTATTNTAESQKESHWLDHYPAAAFVSTVCMTNSQCRWKDSESQMQEYNISRQDKAATVRTLILILDADFAVLAQTTIYLQRDAQWGRRVKAAFDDTTGRPVEVIKPLDDARLFLHAGQIWVSYREGLGFGWDAQVLNPIHFDAAGTAIASLAGSTSTLKATLKASETDYFCCGRNMALMENLQQPDMLQSLTWVDPVTVIDVPTGGQAKKQEQQRRRLADGTKKKRKKKKSHIHGTNAFMVYLPYRNEFLGMGHFHRPTGRDPNDYARFGHHYTHTLFTVSAEPPFALKTLSQEFVLQSPHHPDDAEIIQFASGLEIAGDKLIIAYGVNDCEAGVMQIEWETLLGILQPVEPGTQVLDYMRPLARP